MLVYGALSSVGIGHGLGGEGQISRLLHILHHGGYQPEGIVGTGILQPVDDLSPVRHGDDRGRTEGLLLLLRLKPPGLKQMEAVARRSQGTQQLHNPLSAAGRVGMGNHHGILRRVTIPEAGTAAHLDKGGEAGKHHIDLTLIEIPDIQFGIHALIWR